MNRKQLEKIIRTIVNKFDPERVVLFGSHARGRETEESDPDLFVEMETDRPPPERAIEVSAVFGLRPWCMDVVVYTPAEVERLKKVRGTLLSAIEAEGKVLYERSCVELSGLDCQGRERSPQCGKQQEGKAGNEVR